MPKRGRADNLRNTTTDMADVAAAQTESASQNHRKAVHESAASRKTCDKLGQVFQLRMIIAGNRWVLSESCVGGSSVMLRRFVVLAAIVASTALGALAPAQAANWLEKNLYLSGPRYDGDLPACEAGLRTIASRFS
jgi:hypothetical protein